MQQFENLHDPANGSSMLTRRQFINVASSAALLTMVSRPAAAQMGGGAQHPKALNPKLLPSPDEIWGLLETVNQNGVPRFTGNSAHRRYVDMLESEMQASGLEVARDKYTFPRWEVRKWALSAQPAGGPPEVLPVTFYYPHSGQTGPEGVSGPLVYAGRMASDLSAKPDLSVDMRGKIAFIDYEIVPTNYNDWYRPWGFNVPDTTIPPLADGLGSYPHTGWSLAEYKKAGAVGVIFGWTNVSDEQATGQNWPFGQALQDIPALLVGRETGSKIRQLASSGGTATLTLEADVFQDAGTDSLVATLPGVSRDEVLIVHTHTDGPNIVQENGGVALLSLAKYFSKLPAGSRKRTLVFSLITGHDNAAYLPGKQGSFIQRHPDLMKNAVAAVTIEHFGCKEWRDDESHSHYSPTGKNELGYAITHHETLGKLELESARGTDDRRVAVVEPKQNVRNARYLGIGGSFANTGLPTLGYFGAPSYLNMVAADGCIGKLNKEIYHGQVEEQARLLHALDTTPASDLQRLAPVASRQREAAG